jgi:hypothetical protein
MNTSFSINRFRNLFKKFTVEHLKTYLLSIAVMTGVLVFFTGYLTFIHPLQVQDQRDIFLFPFVGFGFIFSSSMFADAGDKKKAMSMLSLPATHFEKFAVKWVYSYLVFQVLYIALFYGVVALLLNIGPHEAKETRLINIFKEPDAGEIFLGYAVIHAFSLWGSIFFTKLQFVKTGVVVFVCFLGSSMLNSSFMGSILGIKHANALPFPYLGFVEDNEYYSVEAGRNSHIQYIILMYMITFIFWAAAYYRLKEKQV